MYTVTLLSDEQENKEHIDDMDGCRSGENTIKTKTIRSGGTMATMLCSGFIMNISSFLRTEGPTEVLIRIVKTIIGSCHCNEFVCHIVTMLGYDMMCNMISTLLGQRLDDLFYEENKDVQLIHYIFINFGLNRLFIDKFHSKSHKLAACNTHEGVLNLHHPKFKHVSKGINDNICEQFWRGHNKLRPLKATSTEHYNFILILSRELHNDERKRSLEKDGWTWEPISNWPKIRDLNKEDFEIWITKIKTHPYEKWKPSSWKDFVTHHSTDITIDPIKRCKFGKTFRTEYYNVWDRRSSNWKTDDVWRRLIECIHESIIKPLFETSIPPIITSFHEYVKSKMQNYLRNDEQLLLLEKYKDVLQEYLNIIENKYKRYKLLLKTRKSPTKMTSIKSIRRFIRTQLIN